MKRLVSLCLAVVICLGLSIPVAAAKSCSETHLFLLSGGYCNGDGVNVRTGPGTKYPAVGLAYKRDIYHEYQTARKDPGYWCHVHGKLGGWMYARYYTPVDAAGIKDEKA